MFIFPVIILWCPLLDSALAVLISFHIIWNKITEFCLTQRETLSNRIVLCLYVHGIWSSLTCTFFIVFYLLLRMSKSIRLHPMICILFVKCLLPEDHDAVIQRWCLMCLLHLSCERYRAAAQSESEAGAGLCAALCSVCRGRSSSNQSPPPHPSDLVIPSALPASSLHINLPSSFDSSPASLCSLSFIRVLSAEREQSKEQ